MLPKEVDSTGSTSVDSRKYEYMSPQVQVYRFVKYNPLSREVQVGPQNIKLVLIPYKPSC
jgi:hypothetical protein